MAYSKNKKIGNKMIDKKYLKDLLIALGITFVLVFLYSTKNIEKVNKVTNEIEKFALFSRY